MTADELLAEVLRLPAWQRANVAEQILSCLEEPEETVALSWADELDRRSAEVRGGRIQAEDWEAVRKTDSRTTRFTTCESSFILKRPPSFVARLTGTRNGSLG